MSWLGFVAVALVLAGVVLIGWGAYEWLSSNKQK